MQIFHHPPESEVRRLLSDAQLPNTDLRAEHIEHFFGCGPRQAPQGVIGLEIYGSEALLRSLVVAESARGKGCGTALVLEIERYARERGVTSVYLLTTTAAEFFERMGYAAVSRDEAPDCIRATSEFAALCPSSSTFMMKTLPDCVNPALLGTSASGLC